MTRAQLKEQAQQAPFQPFAIRTVSGFTLRIPHPDFIWFPGGSDLVAVSGELGGITAVDPANVEAIVLQSTT